MSVTFALKYEDFEKLKQSIEKYPGSCEEKLNEYIHDVASKEFVQGITLFIPEGKRNSKTKYKVGHAKASTWYEVKNQNLGTDISNISGSSWNNGKFYYLYYVETGTGTSVNKGPRNFYEKGLDLKYDTVIDGMLNAINQIEL